MAITFAFWDQQNNPAIQRTPASGFDGFVGLLPAAPKLFDLVRVTTLTTGTGPIVLGSAVPGFRSFSAAGVPDGATVRYGIGDPGPNPVFREVGTGVYTAASNTLTRVLGSSSTGSLINLSGQAHVFITETTGDLVRRGSFTLAPNANSTVVFDASCVPTSVIIASPATYDAANDMATTWVTPGTGLFTVNHANNSRNDRMFRYAII